LSPTEESYPPFVTIQGVWLLCGINKVLGILNGYAIGE
jgi:hypothetical protein